MKNIFASLIVPLIIVIIFHGCSKDKIVDPLSAVVHWTQDAIDANKKELLTTTELYGEVYLEAGVNDLSAFHNIEKIHGGLYIQFTDLANVEGFQHLTTVNKLQINNNAVLELVEFRSLLHIKGGAYINNNPELIQVLLPQLMEVNDWIYINDHIKLEKIDLPAIEEMNRLAVLDNANFKILSGFTNLDNKNEYTIILDFRQMTCPATLFQNIHSLSSFDVQVKKKEGNDFTWLGNLIPLTNIKVECDVPLSALCPLKNAVNLDDPLCCIILKNSVSGAVFTGDAILATCP